MEALSNVFVSSRSQRSFSLKHFFISSTVELPYLELRDPKVIHSGSDAIFIFVDIFRTKLVDLITIKAKYRIENCGCRP